jgi:hypothetical protein
MTSSATFARYLHLKVKQRATKGQQQDSSEPNSVELDDSVRVLNTRTVLDEARTRKAICC